MAIIDTALATIAKDPHESLRILKQLPAEKLSIKEKGPYYHVAGAIYSALEHHHKALKFYSTSTKYAEAARDTALIVENRLNAGGIYFNAGKYEKASQAIQEGQDLDPAVLEAIRSGRVYSAVDAIAGPAWLAFSPGNAPDWLDSVWLSYCALIAAFMTGSMWGFALPACEGSAGKAALLMTMPLMLLPWLAMALPLHPAAETRGPDGALRASEDRIVDVFPATADHPVRIDQWGDEVERLSEFAVTDQRSTHDIDAVAVGVL